MNPLVDFGHFRPDYGHGNGMKLGTCYMNKHTHIVA